MASDSVVEGAQIRNIGNGVHGLHATVVSFPGVSQGARLHLCGGGGGGGRYFRFYYPFLASPYALLG